MLFVFLGGYAYVFWRIEEYFVRKFGFL